MAISVKAKCFNGQSYDISTQLSDTVSSFQAKVAEKSGIAADRQTLLFKGQVLAEGDKRLSDFNVADGVTVNVVRKVGKSSSASVAATGSAPTAASTKSSSPSTASTTAAPRSATATAPTTTAANTDAMPQNYEDMLRQLQGMMGAGAMGGGAGAAANPFLAGGLGGGGSAGGGGGGGANPLMNAQALPGMFNQLMQQLPGLWNSQQMKEFLDDPEKLEEVRLLVKDNPMFNMFANSDPNVAKHVDNKEAWQDYMQEAGKYFATLGEQADRGGGGGASASVSSGAAAAAGAAGGFPGAAGGLASMLPAPGGVAAGRSVGEKAEEVRKGVGQAAPPGIDIAKISEAYGHALGQSLINSAMGLDPDLVQKGLKDACVGDPFPMSLPDYERQVAAQYLAEANLEDANRFFEETQKDPKINVLKDGRIIWESVETEIDDDAEVVTSSSEVELILEGRLLDGRVFFSCPAADDTGEKIHPLTLSLLSAPPALAESIVGMKEGEARTLYVHPTAADGMTEMFGELLPPNAMLAFDIELVSANASEDVQ